MISNPMLEAESRTTLSDLKPIVVALTPSMLKRNGLRTRLTWVRTPMSTVTSVSSFKIKYPQEVAREALFLILLEEQKIMPLLRRLTSSSTIEVPCSN
jgi:hypothetical protein